MNPKAALALLAYSVRITEIGLANWFRADRKRIVGVALLAAYAGLFGWLVIQSYFAVDALTGLGILLFPYILIIRQPSKFSLRYGVLLLVLSVLSIWLPVRTLHFGMLTVGLLFIVEAFVGKATVLPLLWLGVLSPFFRYASIVFSFPIRLQLSAWAGSIVSACGLPVEVLGNAVRLGDTEFAVDVACMGLQMTEMALLLALFLVAYYERSLRQHLSLGWLVVIVAGTLVLNTLSNLLRILVLIVFHVLPENPMHDVIGLVCLVVYVMLPLVFVIRWLYRTHRKSVKIVSLEKPKPHHWITRLATGIALLALAIVLTQLIFHQTPKRNFSESGVAQLSGFSKRVTSDGIVQLTSPEMLVYVKPIAAFYVAEHSPLICWRGSGYRFTRVEKQTIHGTEIYTGILQKGSDRIYSAWWFDNGSHRTTDQWDWRWRMLRGEKGFCLVNVNVNREEELKGAVNQLFQQRIIQ
jgi:exosortase N